MNKSKIKKHFKSLLQKEFEGKFKFITKPLHYYQGDFVNFQDEIYVGVMYKNYELWFDCNLRFVKMMA